MAKATPSSGRSSTSAPRQTPTNKVPPVQPSTAKPAEKESRKKKRRREEDPPSENDIEPSHAMGKKKRQKRDKGKKLADVFMDAPSDDAMQEDEASSSSEGSDDSSDEEAEAAATPFANRRPSPTEKETVPLDVELDGQLTVGLGGMELGSAPVDIASYDDEEDETEFFVPELKAEPPVIRAERSIPMPSNDWVDIFASNPPPWLARPFYDSHLHPVENRKLEDQVEKSNGEWLYASFYGQGTMSNATSLIANAVKWTLAQCGKRMDTMVIDEVDNGWFAVKVGAQFVTLVTKRPVLLHRQRKVILFFRRPRRSPNKLRLLQVISYPEEATDAQKEALRVALLASFAEMDPPLSPKVVSIEKMPVLNEGAVERGAYVMVEFPDLKQSQAWSTYPSMRIDYNETGRRGKSSLLAPVFHAPICSYCRSNAHKRAACPYDSAKFATLYNLVPYKASKKHKGTKKGGKPKPHASKESSQPVAGSSKVGKKSKSS